MKLSIIAINETYTVLDEVPYGDTGVLPIGSLILSKEEVQAATDNLSRGLPSMTEGPVEVNYHPSLGKFQLTNGYHRLVEALMRGESEIQVSNQGEASWRPPSLEDTYKPDWDADYYGMEEFIESYVLRRL
ncbi:hypothetical protein N9045_00685 [bacterium]|nr:hypothetical protein [bacterium]